MKRIFFAALLLIVLDAVPAAAQRSDRKSEEIVRIDGQRYYVHTVQPAQTLYSLAKMYDVSTAAILHYNPLIVGTGLKAGHVLKIPVTDAQPPKKLSARKQARIFDKHVVEQGETAYSVARRYALPLPTLLEDNPGLDPAHLPIGAELLIRKSEQGESDEAQIRADLEEYRDALNSVSPDYVYHIVLPRQTLYSLSKEYDVPQAAIEQANDLSGGLKAGAILRIPADRSEELAAAAFSGEQAEESAEQPYAEQEPIDHAEGLRPFQAGKLRIAMLLPIEVNGVANANYLEFYQGFLLGLEDLKEQGRSVELDLYNTARSQQRVEEILRLQPLASSDLIVGPVYEELLAPVLDFASRRGVPVVSPLATLSQAASPLLFQMAPAPGAKYDKLAPLFEGDKHIVLIRSSSTDREFEQAIERLLAGKAYTEHRFSDSGMGPLLTDERENLFVVLSDNEMEVDKILASLSSAYNNLTARGQLHSAEIRLVGSPRWNRFGSLDRNLFFKLGLSYVSNYQARRDNEAVAAFDQRYIDAFRMLPTLYSYRGYDAARLFGEGLFSPLGLEDYLRMPQIAPLQTPYTFVQPRRGSTHVNGAWILVRYNSDYTITIQ